MKKSIIAAGAASVALAAMPIVGVFADTSVNDNINAVLTPGCTVTDSLEKTVNIILAPGNVTTTPSTTSVSVTCNSSSWTITAVGATEVPAGYTEGTVTDLIAEDTTTPANSNRIATGTGTSASSWAFRVADLYDPNTSTTVASGASVEGDYDEFSQIPSTPATIVTGTAPVTMQLKTQYKVYTAPTQAGGNYEGKVTYTVAD
ncbi:hypothetical protein IJG93_03845 [Candidatus Saccharibacteria bacterium]|nr:hypothetical protein [Candidatus Saccharibacteria bacterium]